MLASYNTFGQCQQSQYNKRTERHAHYQRGLAHVINAVVEINEVS